MNVADLLGLVALLTKTVDTVRFTARGHLNGLITQLIAWGLGVGGVFAVAQTQWASHISVGNGGTLAGQGALSLVAIGLAIASGGSVLNDLRSAVDSTNTAVIPPLFGSAFSALRGTVDQASTVKVSPQVHDFTDGALAQIEGALTRVLGQSIGSLRKSPAPAASTPSHSGDIRVDLGAPLTGGAVATERVKPADPAAVFEAPAPPEADHGITHPDFAVAADVPTPPAPTT